MADEVVGIRRVTDKLNPAAMEDVINKLIASTYPAPAWVRQGPNYTKNAATGEVVNLNQEATKILEANPLREDVQAVVAKEDGSHEVLWIDETAVKQAGGDLNIVKANLQAALSPVFSTKTLIISAGVVVGLVVMYRTMKKRGARA